MWKEPRVLILGSRTDFSCDYVVSQLRRREISYLRLNSEDCPGAAISLIPTERKMTCTLAAVKYRLTEETLRSIWFRRASYLRDYGSQIPAAIEQQVARVQWSAFMRSLLIFEQCKWMNNPASTYYAEHKAVQLWRAGKLGMQIPPTIFTNDSNSVNALGSGSLVLKGIDTVLAYADGMEFFAFAQKLEGAEIAAAGLSSIPVTVQPLLEPKVDIRVTVVGKRVFAARITRAGRGVVGDWRNQKEGLTFEAFALPETISNLCLKLTSELGLLFGGLDLAETKDGYIFLEINPTGEWAWLVDAAKLPIDEAIADALI